jgi:hypothetical protein
LPTLWQQAKDFFVDSKRTVEILDEPPSFNGKGNYEYKKRASDWIYRATGIQLPADSIVPSALYNSVVQEILKTKRVKVNHP